VLERPWEFQLTEFRYVLRNFDNPESFIEFVLTKGTETRRLRFWAPRGLAISEGFDPTAYLGLQIHDLSSRQLDGISVEVSCFENTAGLRFFAREVEDLSGDRAV
jgi:hypothetical protein